MDRHVIANMGAELGATATVFPSDGEIKRFLKEQGREDDWIELKADQGATMIFMKKSIYQKLSHLIAKPTSPGNVVPVRKLLEHQFINHILVLQQILVIVILQLPQKSSKGKKLRMESRLILIQPQDKC